MKELVSVIVPAYNADKYIGKCIRSIVCQTYENIEVIIVNDGSADGTEELCENYIKSDKRIKLINQSNMGLVSARRTGISQAKGKYLTFVDADDWIESNFIERFFLNSTEDCRKLVVSNVITMESKSGQWIESCSVPEGSYSHSKIVTKVLPRLVYDEAKMIPGVFAHLVGKMFDTEKFRQKYKRIDNRITLGEDGAFVFPYIADAEHMTVIDNPGYHYVQHESSMSCTLGVYDIEKLKVLQKCLDDQIKEHESYDIVKHQADIYVRDLLIRVLRSSFGLELGKILCTPPYELIPKGSRIVLYGAGRVGKEFAKGFLQTGYAEIVGWVDRGVRGNFYGIRIVHPEQLKDMVFDVILISMNREEDVAAIRNSLVSQSIESDRIIWKPVRWG